MLNREKVEHFRRMSPDERARIGIELTELMWQWLVTLPPDVAQRIIDSEREPWNPLRDRPTSTGPGVDP